MANKSRALKKLEDEIEKFRGEANWAKVDDITKQNVGKFKGLEDYLLLVSAECKLERHFHEYPIENDNNFSISHNDTFQHCITTFKEIIRKTEIKEYKLEANLLKVKIYFACKDFSICLENYEKLKLESLNTNLIPIRRLKLIAEAFSIKGLCLENSNSSNRLSKFKGVNNQDAIISCFERAGDLALLLIQSLRNKTMSTLSTWNASLQPEVIDLPGIGSIIEKSMQKSPLAYIVKGDLQKGISRSREVLQCVETASIPHLRQTLARQLAELLLRGVCESTYIPLNKNEVLSTHRTPPSAPSSPKPKKYDGGRRSPMFRRPFNSFELRETSLYVPEDLLSEILLLLLIADTMVTREALVTRRPEFREERIRRFENATAVYDLITIALTKHGQFNIIFQTFERAMKFAFDEIHIWRQFALSLYAARQYDRSLLAFRRCHKIKPNDYVVCLQAAQICFDHVRDIKEGIEWTKTAIKLTENTNKCIKSRALLALGVGYTLMVDETKIHSEKAEYRKKASACFDKAHSLDPENYLPLYHIALQQALNRSVNDALRTITLALKKKPDHVHSLHLLALLLSSQQKFNEALNVIVAAVVDYPDNFSLLFTKSRLQVVAVGFDEALSTCLSMLKLWKKMFEKGLDGQERGTGLLNKCTADHRSLIHTQLNELSDRESVKHDLTQRRFSDPGILCESDTDRIYLQVPEQFKAGSVRNESICASKIEAQLSDLASSVGSKIEQKPGPSEPWVIQSQIWLHLAELYLEEGRLEDAERCVTEAGVINPLSYLVAYLKGRLAEMRYKFREAKECYENALSINSCHVKTYQHMGIIYQALGQLRMSEKMLRDAINVDPTCPEAWSLLGQVVHDLGDPNDAVDCFSTAAELELTKPVLPFSILPKHFL